MQSLSENVDLSHFLPEWVTFEFSAATETSFAIHTIYSYWDFSSSLEIDNNISSTKKSLSIVRLAVALSVGGYAVIAIGLFYFAL